LHIEENVEASEPVIVLSAKGHVGEPFGLVVDDAGEASQPNVTKDVVETFTPSVEEDAGEASQPNVTEDVVEASQPVVELHIEENVEASQPVVGLSAKEHVGEPFGPVVDDVGEASQPIVTEDVVEALQTFVELQIEENVQASEPLVGTGPQVVGREEEEG
jgi:hypothetical protein